MQRPQLLPCPRHLALTGDFFVLPKRTMLELDPALKPDEARAIARRIRTWSAEFHPGEIHFGIESGRGREKRPPDIRAVRSSGQPAEHYAITIDAHGVLIEFADLSGLRAAVATLRQLLHQYGRRLPRLRIRDRPDFPRRGYMLDISRGRVPKLATLLELADKLADFKINELQLYTEHTFAYRSYESVWRDWGALTGAELRQLDARCRDLGIDLVPNQNSFGHLREFLTHPELKPLAEIQEPWPDERGSFWRYPSTLAPSHPGTLPFLRGLYDELLPNFSSPFFNIGGDETWDLGRGQSRRQCEQRGKGRVYLSFLKRIHREVTKRGRRMMFWGDIILRHPELIRELPRDVIALNWGYEADHPFEIEARQFAQAKIPFYVCPGTSTWATLVGKHDNAFGNLRAAAKAGLKNGAIGYLITDWGDGGHPQPPTVSWFPLLFGAGVSWCAKSFDESQLVPVASRELFDDPSLHAAQAALALGLTYKKLGCLTPNATPLGATLAAPLPETHELFCRDGLKYYARLRPNQVEAARVEIEKQRRLLRRARPTTETGELMIAELDLAARMAAASCQIMRWQQTLAAGRRAQAKRMAQAGIRDLRKLEQDFNALWPRRNKGTAVKSSPFFQWRIADYLCARLHFAPEIARRA